MVTHVRSFIWSLYLIRYILIDTDFQIILLKRLTWARDSRSYTFQHSPPAVGTWKPKLRVDPHPACIIAAQAAKRLYHSQTGLVVLAMCCLAIGAPRSKGHAMSERAIIHGACALSSCHRCLYRGQCFIFVFLFSPHSGSQVINDLDCFFLNPNLYPASHTKQYRGGHVEYVLWSGRYGVGDESELADHG